MNQDQIRNFSIIAHIDHGKSTLADGFLELTRALSPRHKKDQFLDTMDIERERGITIKAQTVRLNYQSRSGKNYQLNLIDTPGHVDFSYEVSRSLAACEGVVLVVDAAQGVEAQTMAHASLAVASDLVIIAVLNKVDLPQARPEDISSQVRHLIGIKEEDILPASAKQKTGIVEILESVVNKIPPPSGKQDQPLKALVFDSWFDTYQGVVTLCRIVDGGVKVGDEVCFMQGGKKTQVLKLGVFTPFPRYLNELQTGEVGFVITGIKGIRDIPVGDTLTFARDGALKPLKGFQKLNPVVFAGLYPTEPDEFLNLKTALQKLTLNDSSLQFEADSSPALGFGFRCGFLGRLHMEIVQERLEREFNLDLVVTAPSVIYQVFTKDGKKTRLESPAHLPDPTQVDYMEEPFVRVSIHIPSPYVGAVLKLCEERRGTQIRMEYSGKERVIIEYHLPLSEIVTDFYDKLKSLSRGYGSMEYEWDGFQRSPLVKLDVLLNGQAVDALSVILHKSEAQQKGRALAQKLKKLIHRQQYQVAIQAAIGSKVVARETLSALRKDVTAKCYGGDITRKRKLLEKQKKGKRRMKAIGRVEVPQAAFMAMLKIND